MTASEKTGHLFPMKKILSFLFSCLLFTPVVAQTKVVVATGEESRKDTTNVERYDDTRLEPLVSSLQMVPWFHTTKDMFWYTWHQAGGESEYYIWQRGKGKRKVTREATDRMEARRWPMMNPYGTSNDSIWRLSEDSVKNLLLENLQTHRVVQLSSDGNAEFPFEKIDVVWMKNGKFILSRVDHRGVRKFAMMYGGAYFTPTARTYEYEIPGDTIVKATHYYVGDCEKATLTEVDVSKWPCQEIVPQKADGVEDRIFFWRKKKTRDIAELCSINADGRLTTILTEACKPRINPDMFYCKIVNHGNDIFLWSDRTGWGQIYHYDGKGRLLNAVTSGEWTAGKICGVDEKGRIIYFYGYGREKGRNPYYQHLYSASFDGGNVKLLTPENAQHDVFVSPNNRIFVDTYSTVSLPPTVIVRDAHGKLLDTIEKSDVSELYAYGWHHPEPFTVKAADGKTDLYGLMWKPYDFDATRKYPIISQVYPGPFTETVWNEFTVFDRYHNAALAQRGFIVVVFGHRGSSPLRDKAYNIFGYGNLRDYALADDKVGLEQLAKKYSFIDIDRVGIVGHSGGGMMAAAAIMTFPDFYKVAVASSGNYDNRVYNRMWGETYQGIEGDKTPFKVKTVQELAPRLKGHLLLVTGDQDQNVHPIHTQRLVEALIEANKDFELLVLPGQEHHYDFLHQMYFERRKRDFFEKWLIRSPEKKP